MAALKPRVPSACVCTQVLILLVLGKPWVSLQRALTLCGSSGWPVASFHGPWPRRRPPSPHVALCCRTLPLPLGPHVALWCRPVGGWGCSGTIRWVQRRSGLCAQTGPAPLRGESTYPGCPLCWVGRGPLGLGTQRGRQMASGALDAWYFVQSV